MAGSDGNQEPTRVSLLHHLAEQALAFHQSPQVHHRQQLPAEQQQMRTMVLPIGAPAGVLVKNPWPVLAILCLGFFMILLDTTIVNIAVPSIINALNATLDQVLWVLNAYILVYAALLIPAGRLGEVYGQRTLFLIGIVIFVVASAGCGLASTPNQLLGARVAQGVGGACMTPQTLALLTEVFPHRKRGIALGIWGAVAGVATAAGPLLGGLVVSDLGWRWIFYINLPIGLITIIGSIAVVPDLKPSKSHEIDLVGVLSGAAGLTLVVYGLIEGQRYNWGAFLGPITIIETMVAGGVLLLGFIFWERLHRQPLIPTSLFLSRNFALASLVGAMVGFGLLAFFFIFTLYLQSALGMSALEAGLVISPLPIASILTAPLAGRLSDRLGGRPLLMVGLLLFAVGFAWETMVATADAAALTLIPALVVAGAGLGMTFAPLTAMAMNDIRADTAGVAAGVLNTTRQVGSALGGAVVGAMLQSQLVAKLHDEAVSRSSGLPPSLRDHVLAMFPANGSATIGQAARSIPAGVPPQLAQQFGAVIHAIVTHGFVDAMKLPLLAGAGVLLVGALTSSMFAGRRTAATAATAATASPGTSPQT
jgi:EmrB/QacA subfamily drug resistance transporter